jgi:hypothetical protein
MQYILVFGDPVNGYTFQGPFATADDAMAYGEPIMQCWWIAELHEPELLIVEGGNDESH